MMKGFCFAVSITDLSMPNNGKDVDLDDDDDDDAAAADDDDNGGGSGEFHLLVIKQL
jgi:hypothetical protein